MSHSSQSQFVQPLDGQPVAAQIVPPRIPRVLWYYGAIVVVPSVIAFLVALGFVGYEFWVEQELLVPMKQAAPALAVLPNLNESILQGTRLGEDCPALLPHGRVAGKYVLIEFDPKNRTGVLHAWHSPKMFIKSHDWGDLAREPDEVKTIFLLHSWTEVVGEYPGGVRNGVATAELMTVTVIDRDSAAVIGQFHLRDDPPQTSRNAESQTGRISNEELLDAIHRLPRN